MRRRTLLQGIGAATIPLSGCTSTVGDIAGEVENATGGVLGSEETEPGVYEFGSFSPGFERAEWMSDGTLEITFSDDHDMDAYGIRYSSKSKPEDDIVFEKAPGYGGTEAVSLIGKMRGMASIPPTGKYNLYAYQGRDGGVFFSVSETLGSVSLDVTPELTIENVSLVDDTKLTLDVTNTGTAPAYLNAIEASRRVTLKSIIGVGETKTIQPEKSPFGKDENCTVVPPEAQLSLHTAPKTDASHAFNSPYDETKRYCVVSF